MFYVFPIFRINAKAKLKNDKNCICSKNFALKKNLLPKKRILKK